MKKIIIYLVCLFFLTGCNYEEVESLAIVSTLTIDYKDGEYHLILEIGKIENKENIAYYLETSADSIEKAIEYTNRRFNKTLYFANLDLLLLSQEALNHLDAIIKYINQDMNFSYNFNLAISDNPDELFEYAKDYENILGIFMQKVFRNDLNKQYNITYLEFLKIYTNNHITRLPIIKMNNNQIEFNANEVKYE